MNLKEYKLYISRMYIVTLFADQFGQVSYQV